MNMVYYHRQENYFKKQSGKIVMKEERSLHGEERDEVEEITQNHHFAIKHEPTPGI